MKKHQLILNTQNLRMFVLTFNSVQRAYVFTFIRATFYVVMTIIDGVIGGYVFSKMSFPRKRWTL